MIYTLAITKENKIIENLSLTELQSKEIKWYWVDFSKPKEEESNLLETHFGFHPLAIEDCLHFIQRPKLDHYEDYSFFVFHSIEQNSLEITEVDCFLGKNYVVSFHKIPSREIEKVKKMIKEASDVDDWKAVDVLHELVDNLVDMYFPIAYQLEDKITELEENTKGLSTQELLEQLFDIRSDLIHLRKTFVPMRELLYRVVNSQKIFNTDQSKPYFIDIHDHLVRICEILEANRELTGDIRDSYISLNTNRMNTIMMTLTVITTIFMPLTFIAGVYGMNFTNMPELNYKYGYYVVLGAMATIGLSLFGWFRKKGWFKK